MVASTIRMICKGVVFGAAPASNGADTGSPPGPSLVADSRVRVRKSTGSITGGNAFGISDLPLLKVVLIEHANAVRAFLAVAQGIKSVTVAQDHPPHLALGSEGETWTH